MSSLEQAGCITAGYLVQEVVERHPQVIAIFQRHGLQCVGCYISTYHTIADSAREYALDVEPLLNDLNRAVLAGGSGGRRPLE
jgi:hybrid cluster-associated redox disulfide protein